MINEVVYADKSKVNTKKKTIGLTYSKGNRAKQNFNVFDKLGTDEMDQDNANTIEIPLKGGLISYNITDIKGVDIMHYFKKKWGQRQRVTMNVHTNDGNTDAYELQMDNNEEREFLNRFVTKVEYVIREWIKKNKKQDINFTQISILPVNSTSNFNKKFVKEELSRLNIGGLRCIMVNPDIIIKDLSKLQRDEDFISKNKKFYDSDYAINRSEMGTVNQRVNNVVGKNLALNQVNDYIVQINHIVKMLLNFIQNSRKTTQLSKLQIERLTTHYKNYIDLVRLCYNVSYTDYIDNKSHTLRNDQILNMIKYSKGPSIDKRSELIWKMVEPYLIDEKSYVDNKPYEQIPLCYWKRPDFEIKKLRNSERLGLKNFYNINKNLDDKTIQEEIDKMKGTILLVFDDNISGGATLSDVCFQCKQLGAENIIPITFGKMSEANTMKGIVLNTPDEGYDFSTDNNLSLYNGDKKEKRKNIKKDDRLNDGKKIFYQTFNIDSNKPVLNIVWLDALKEPYSYFSNSRNSSYWKRNYDYYVNNVFNQYNPNFIWFKDIDDFIKYIEKNPNQNMISFDNDIRYKNYLKQHITGVDVTDWLLKYYKQHNIKLPLLYPHSNNKNDNEIVQSMIQSYEDINENIIKISERELRQIITESVKKLLLL